eukprot:2205529-Amphidinium_carterae.1
MEHRYQAAWLYVPLGVEGALAATSVLWLQNSHFWPYRGVVDVSAVPMFPLFNHDVEEAWPSFQAGASPKLAVACAALSLFAGDWAGLSAVRWRPEQRPKMWDVRSSNVGGWGTGRAQLAEWAAGDTDLPDVWCVQETRLSASSEVFQRSVVAGFGFRAFWCGAVRGEHGGWSAGCAVLVRKHVPAMAVDLPAQPCLRGRVSAARVMGCFPGGFLAVSLYLLVGATRLQRLLELEALIDWLQVQVPPFLLCGDWNTVLSASDMALFAERLGGHLIGP